MTRTLRVHVVVTPQGRPLVFGDRLHALRYANAVPGATVWPHLAPIRGAEARGTVAAAEDEQAARIGE